MASERRRKSLKHERRVLWLALLTGAPGLVLALALLWTGDFAPRTQWTLTTVVVVVWLGLAATLREHVIRPLQTISNMLAALRERDFSMRARGSNPADALGLLLLERSEEHTSELQSQSNLVCRLLLEKKKNAH